MFISAWAILLFVQQYRAILTASECGSDSERFTLFCIRKVLRIPVFNGC